MPPMLIKAIGFVSIGMAVWGLVSGRILAGSRGLRPNYLAKEDSPLLYTCFVCIYAAIGAFLISMSW